MLGNMLAPAYRKVPDNQWQQWQARVALEAQELRLSPALVSNAFLVKFPLQVLVGHTSQEYDNRIQALQGLVSQRIGDNHAIRNQLKEHFLTGPPFMSPCIVPDVKRTETPALLAVPGFHMVPYLDKDEMPSQKCLSNIDGYVNMFFGRGLGWKRVEKEKRGFSQGVRRREGIVAKPQRIRLRKPHMALRLWFKVKCKPVKHSTTGFRPIPDGARKDGQNITFGAHTFVLWAIHGNACAITECGEDIRLKTCCMHVCNNKTCVNPLHLWWGHHSENKFAGLQRDTACEAHSTVVSLSLRKSEDVFGLPKRSIDRELSVFM